MEWLGKAEAYLAEDQPILGDLDTVNILIEQHKVGLAALTVTVAWNPYGRYGESSAGSYLADPTSSIPSQVVYNYPVWKCPSASIVVTYFKSQFCFVSDSVCMCILCVLFEALSSCMYVTFKRIIAVYHDSTMHCFACCFIRSRSTYVVCLQAFQQEVESRQSMVAAIRQAPGASSADGGAQAAQLEQLAHMWERVTQLTDVREARLQEALKLVCAEKERRMVVVLCKERLE